MLPTLTTTRRPATDLGFLLHKHPDRGQGFDVPFGRAFARREPLYRVHECVFAVLALEGEPLDPRL